MATLDPVTILNEMRGKELLVVRFVMDYLQLEFDHCWITIYSEFVVSAKGSILRSTQTGYRELLVSLIGKRLDSLHAADERFVITFVNHQQKQFIIADILGEGRDSVDLGNPENGLISW